MNDAFTVTRTIPVSPPGINTLNEAVQKLVAIECVDFVGDLGNGHLKIRYDASVMGLGDIEGILDAAGVSRPANLWWRLKSGWYRYLDRNARSNALSKGSACCNKPPARLK